MVVNRKQVDVTVSSFVPAVLECANCSLHPTAEGALSAVSLSTVPRLSCCPGSPVVCEWGSGCAGEGGRRRQHLTCCAFTHDQMMPHLDEYCCSAK